MHDTKRSAHKRPFEPTISIIVVMISSLCIHFAEIFFFFVSTIPASVPVSDSLSLFNSFFFLPAAYVRVHIHSTSFFHLHFYIIWVSYSYLFHSQFLTSCSSICIETLALILSQHNNLAMSLLLCSPNIRVAFPHICFNVPRWLLISASFSFP